MVSRAFGLAVTAGALLAMSQAQAQPMAATYTGLLWGSDDPFTAVFHYDTKDLVPSPGASGYLDARSGTVQWVTYTDPFRSLVFKDPSAFSKGEYDSIVYDPSGSGDISEIDTVHDYSITSPSGYLSLTFGGVGDNGLVTFGPDGLDYLELDPRSFALTKTINAAVSPVPLPPGAPLFAAALGLLGIWTRKRSGRASLRAPPHRPTPNML